ncbi:MAG: 3-isopropylmalate dehydratase small subunit [Gammaproteobacteria bacterium]|nr:3-isopropylmalate dehydratase small subunit [Gammaproteobacteria bacterium]
MKPFGAYEGIAVPLLRNNIDTDAIIPSREMRQVSKKGLGTGLFAGWRYLNTDREARALNPDFVLNQPQYAAAGILLAGANFGCGSSREHAVWALLEYGFRAVIAPGFGSIFYHNAMRNGLLPIRLPEAAILNLCNADAARLTIDLHSTTVATATGLSYRFEIEPLYRDLLLQGMDAIDLTLQRQDAIEKFQARDRQQRSWAYLR